MHDLRFHDALIADIFVVVDPSDYHRFGNDSCYSAYRVDDRKAVLASYAQGLNGVVEGHFCADRIIPGRSTLASLSLKTRARLCVRGLNNTSDGGVFQHFELLLKAVGCSVRAIGWKFFLIRCTDRDKVSCNVHQID